ncbi:hypothetical protein D8S78_13935 [Natrialba swarupiae]|nr:hypothetical protein [Natrialba swarupiae]
MIHGSSNCQDKSSGRSGRPVRPSNPNLAIDRQSTVEDPLRRIAVPMSRRGRDPYGGCAGTD